MQLIPSIDLRGGKCVRLLRGDFAQETIYDRDPRELVDSYRRMGAPALHIVDLDGARDGDLSNRNFILSLGREHLLPLQVGGGIRDIAALEQLLDAGIDRVAIGSAAVERPDEVAAWLKRFGAARICLALDIRLNNGQPYLQTRGWTAGSSTTLWQAVDFFLDHGLVHVLCTDVERDGALEGPNLTLYADCVVRYPQIKWQASGGVRGAHDLDALHAVGVTSTVSGKALLEGLLSEAELRQWFRC